MVVEVGSDDAMWPWFLFLMFLPLPFTIWLSLVLAGLAVSDCGLSLLQACVSELLGDQFSPGGIWVWTAVVQVLLWSADRNQKDPAPGCPLVPVSEWLLGQEFEQKWWSYLCSQVSQHSWETRSLLTVFGYGAPWHRSSSGCGLKPEGFCPRLLLGSHVLRAPSESLGADMVVLPVLTGMSSLLGAQLSSGNISVRSNVALT